jgi:hypothetical protein
LFINILAIGEMNEIFPLKYQLHLHLQFDIVEACLPIIFKVTRAPNRISSFGWLLRSTILAVAIRLFNNCNFAFIYSMILHFHR